MCSKKFVCAGFLLVVALTACAAPPQVPRAPERQPIRIENSDLARPVVFKGVISGLKRGEKYGVIRTGITCIVSYESFGSGSMEKSLLVRLGDTFGEELDALGYPVIGWRDELFREAENSAAEYEIAAIIANLNGDVCVPHLSSGDARSTGAVYLAVEWQVFSRLDRKVIYKATTEGTGQVPQPRYLGDEEAIDLAFAQATRNLLADRAFHELIVRRESAPQVQQAVASGLTLAARPLFEGGFSANASAVRLAVATVFAGGGHGSGFYLDERGYLLTNEHVVGKSRFVKVKLVTGREVLGEVIATHSVRDVALVKTEAVGIAGLPLQTATPTIGSDVYAIGSPLDEKYDVTVTRGIVGAYRQLEGQNYLQSDVNIQPGNSGGPLVDASGNVVAISVRARIGQGGDPVGINFFIPIAEAAEALGIALP